MPLKGVNDTTEIVIVLVCSFVIGAVAQYARIQAAPVKEGETPPDRIKSLWSSVGAGIASAAVLGYVVDKHDISPGLVFSLAGVTGWAGSDVLKIGWDVMKTTMMRLSGTSPPKDGS